MQIPHFYLKDPENLEFHRCDVFLVIWQKLHRIWNWLSQEQNNNFINFRELWVKNAS